MTDGRPHIWLEQLKEPRDATLYLWAPTGDIAFAHATESVGASLREAVRKGWPSFRWALPLKMGRDYVTIARNEAVMMQATVTFRTERFRHKKYHDAHAARFDTVEDQERFLEALPHLAIDKAEVEALSSTASSEVSND